MKYCSQCGQQTQDEDRFCNRCGAVLSRPNDEDPASRPSQPDLTSSDNPSEETRVDRGVIVQTGTDGLQETGIVPITEGSDGIGPGALPMTGQMDNGTAPPSANRDGKVLKRNRRIIVWGTALALLLTIGGAGWWWTHSTEARSQQKLDLAVKYLCDNNFDKAVLAYNDAIKIDPKNVQAYEGLAKSYTVQGKFTEAESAYQRGLGAVAPESQVRLQLGQAGMYVDKKDLAAAENAFQAIVSDSSECVEAYQGLSLVYRLQGDRDKARIILETAAEKNPDNYIAFNQLAAFYMGAEQQEKALGFAARSLQLEPDQQDAYTLLEEMCAGRWGQLLPKIAAVSDSRTALMISLAASFQDGKYSAVLTEYKNAFEQDAHLKPLILAAISSLKLGNIQEAGLMLEKVIKTEPNQWIMADVAWYYLEAGDQEKAQQWAKKALQAGGGNLKVLKLLAQTLGDDKSGALKLMTTMHLVYNWQPVIYVNKQLARQSILSNLAVPGNAGWPSDLAGMVTMQDSDIPISGATLEVYDQAGALVAKAQTDPHGKYQAAVNPGRYRLKITALLFQDGEFQDVMVKDNEMMVFNAKLKKTESASGLQGIILDAATGAPILDAQVEVFDSTSKKLSTVVSDNTGKFELLLMPLAGYSINIAKEGYLPETYQAIEVAAGNLTFLETILQVSSNAQNGAFSGHVYNALNGQGVGGLAINFRRGINHRESGSIEFTVSTEADGSFRSADVKPGNYTGEALGSGYQNAYFTVVCVGGRNTPEQNTTITPILPEGQTRIVLSWGQNPSDVDAHLTGPTEVGSRFNVFFSSRKYNDYVDLDIDDTSSFGPETITIRKQIQGTYRFSVHNYSDRTSSNSSRLSQSGAKVMVYRGSMPVQTFHVPANTGGTLWEVFEINGNTLTPTNRMSYQQQPTAIP